MKDKKSWEEHFRQSEEEVKSHSVMSPIVASGISIPDPEEEEEEKEEEEEEEVHDTYENVDDELLNWLFDGMLFISFLFSHFCHRRIYQGQSETLSFTKGGVL